MHGPHICAHCGSETSAWLDMPVDPMRRCEMVFGRVRRCTSCHLGSVWPLPDKGEVPAFYEIEDYYTHGASKTVTTLSLADRALGKIAWLLDKGEVFGPAKVAGQIPSRARIVDLGCGDARLLREFQSIGHDVIGVDPDPQARAEAARHGVEVLEGTAEELPRQLVERKFDLVIMTHVLEHCIDPALALRQCFDLLADDGMLYCEVPNCACTHFSTFTVCSTMFDAPRHLHFLSPPRYAR